MRNRNTNTTIQTENGIGLLLFVVVELKTSPRAPPMRRFERQYKQIVIWLASDTIGNRRSRDSNIVFNQQHESTFEME